MIKDGYEIKETLKCWCGVSGDFHHVSSANRNDKKKTVWYKCPYGHKIYDEVATKTTWEC